MIKRNVPQAVITILWKAIRTPATNTLVEVHTYTAKVNCENITPHIDLPTSIMHRRHKSSLEAKDERSESFTGGARGSAWHFFTMTMLTQVKS